MADIVPPSIAYLHAQAEATTELSDLLSRMRESGHKIAQAQEEKRAIMARYLTFIAENFSRTGDSELMREALAALIPAYGAGAQREWVAAGLPHPMSLTAKSIYRHDPNDGEGRWRGTWPIEDGGFAPPMKVPVVYQLLTGVEVVYIGSTLNLVSRLRQHSKEKDFDGWRAAQCASEKACRDLETALIDHYRPPLNRVIPKPRLNLVTD